MRAIVLTGADPALCAGLDLSELAQADSALEARTHARWRGGGIDAAEVDRRRHGVIARGRSQA